MSRAYPASTPEQKVEYLFATFAHLTLAEAKALALDWTVPVGQRWTKFSIERGIFDMVAKQAKQDGLYGPRTALYDISWNLHKVYFPIYLHRRQREEAAVPLPGYRERRDSAALNASMGSACL